MVSKFWRVVKRLYHKITRKILSQANEVGRKNKAIDFQYYNEK